MSSLAKGILSKDIVINFAAIPVAKGKTDKNLVLGWAMVAIEDDGEFYQDTQGSYLSQKLIFDSALDFMIHSRKSDDMHDERQRGVVCLAWPFIDGYSDGFALPANKRGFAIGVSFDDETFAKYERGEYTGFSVGGIATAKILPNGVCPECEKPRGACTCKGSDHQKVEKSAELGGVPHKYLSFKLNWISAVTYPAQAGAQSLVVAKRNTLTPATKTSENPAMDPTQLATALEVAKKRLEDISTLSGSQFDVFKAMTGDGQTRFLAMSNGERDAAVRAAVDADPVVMEYQGQKVRKSAGEGIIAVLTAAKARDEQHAQDVEVHKAQVYKARVVSDIPHLALDEAAGIELLVAVDTVKNAEMRGKITTALKAFSDHNADAGKPRGVRGGSVTQVRKNGDNVAKSAGAIYVAGVHKFAAEKQISIPAAYVEYPESSAEAKAQLQAHEAEKREDER